MSGKRYLNWSILSILGAFVIFTLLLFFILRPVFHNPMWVIVGTYLWFFIFVLMFFNRISPFYLCIKGEMVIFVGYPWVYKLKKEWVDKVVIEPTGIIFKPKVEYQRKYKWVPNSPMDRYKGYKVIKFANYRAIGALIDELRSVIVGTDSWDKIKPKWRRYLEDKLYGE